MRMRRRLRIAIMALILALISIIIAAQAIRRRIQSRTNSHHKIHIIAIARDNQALAITRLGSPDSRNKSINIGIARAIKGLYDIASLQTSLLSRSAACDANNKDASIAVLDIAADEASIVIRQAIAKSRRRAIATIAVAGCGLGEPVVSKKKNCVIPCVSVEA